MKRQVRNKLLQLEEEQKIKVLYAVESGSRAWGFASADSDWDVRVLYVHPPEWYLSIDEKRDSIEAMFPNDIDLAGWELQKALKLFRKSNPSLLEWLSSPIVYKEQFSAAESLRSLSPEYFNPKANIYHYLSMAQGNYNKFLCADQVNAKKYFYALRSILACKWVEAKQSPAPVEFLALVKAFVTEKRLYEEIVGLMKRKADGKELDKVPKNQLIHDFLETEIAYFNRLVKQYGKTPQPGTEKLNKLFLRTLKEVW